MTKMNNFDWLADDINDTLVLKVIYKKENKEEFYGVFNISDVLETTGDELEVETANIDDLTNLLTLGIVRFVNINDRSDVLDIPFRKLYLLYKEASVLGENMEQKMISVQELDTFSIIDGTVKNDFLVVSAKIDQESDDLREVMKIAYEFGNYSMQEKFDALSKVNLINHRRMLSDKREKKL